MGEMDAIWSELPRTESGSDPQAGRGLKPVMDARHPLDAFPAALDHLDSGAFG